MRVSLRPLKPIKLNLDYEIYIPDRKKEGYGPSIESFNELIKNNVKIIEDQNKKEKIILL